MSSLLPPYEYYLCDELKYQFVTVNHETYIAYFLDAKFYNEAFKDVYLFNFDIYGNKPKYDERISITVCSIIRDFFKQHQNALIFICDSSDGREMGRSKLFHQWYKSFKNLPIHKIDRYCTVEGYNLYSSLLIHKENPRYEAIISGFGQWMDNGGMPEE